MTAGEVREKNAKACPKCGGSVTLVSIRCGRDAGRVYRCDDFACQWTNAYEAPDAR